MSQVLLLIPPAVAVASLIVHTLAFVAPVGLLRNFGLASITPTTTDGPRLWMGVLGERIATGPSLRRIWPVSGSCARRNYSAHINCTRASLFPKYGKFKFWHPWRVGLYNNSFLDLSVLSKDDATLFEAATPSNVLAALICTSIVFTILFCILLAFRASALWTVEGVPSLSRKRVFDVVIIFTGLAGFLGRFPPCCQWPVNRYSFSCRWDNLRDSLRGV